MATQSHCPVSLPRFVGLLHLIGSPSGGLFSLSGDSSSGATSRVREIAQGHRKKHHNICAQGESYRHITMISMLPDNVLLDIFDFYRKGSEFLDAFDTVWEWYFLVQVCQRWRQIILESPRRLNLRILCTYGTPVRKDLGIWPAFPIVINYEYQRSVQPNDEDNVVAALEHPDRVYHLGLNVTGSQLDKMATVMQEPFPVLARLYIHSKDGNAPTLPAEFLGGSAPCLRSVYLEGIPFPALPTLLLSATDLVSLYLSKIPPAGYIAPKAMVAALAALPRLEGFVIEFQSAATRPDRMCLPPITRTVLPALTVFEFKGASEYLEDLVAEIDSPQLDQIRIDYLNQIVDFQVPQLSEFVDRSVGSKLALFRHAEVTFSSDRVFFEMYRHEFHPTLDRRPAWTSILCQGIDWQVSHIAQVLSHVSVTLSNVVHLELKDKLKEGRRLESTDDVGWPHLLHQFSNVQTLHVSRELAGHVALAFEDITGELAAEVLPSLYLIYLADQRASSIRNFVAARRLFDRPVTVVNTKIEFDKMFRSCVSE